MKNLIPFALLLICFSFSHYDSPDYKVNWGPEYKVEGGLYSSFYPVGLIDDHYYIVSRPKNANTLLKFDLNHKLVSTKSMDLKHGKKPIVLSSFVETSSGHYGYHYSWDKKRANELVYVSRFEDGNYSNPKECYNFEYSDKNDYYGDLSSPRISADKSKVGFLSYRIGRGKKNEKMRVILFDDQFDLMWEQSHELPFQDKKGSVVQTLVSNSGDVFVTVKLSLEKKDRKKGVPVYEYKVYQVGKEGVVNSFDIDLGDDIPTDVGMFFTDAEDDIIFGGMYTTKDKGTGLNGVFFMKFNLANGSSTYNLEPFSKEVLEDLVKDRKIEKGEGLSYSYNIEDMVTFENHSFSFLFEQYYVRRSTTTDSNGNVKVTYTYYSNAILIPRFDVEGNLLSIEKIDKTFKSGTSLNTSYSMAFHDGKIFLVYNDFKDKSERSDLRAEGKKGKKRSRYTDMTVISEEGEILFQETLFSNKNIETEFVPRFSMHDDDVLIIGGMGAKGAMYFGKRTYQFGTIELK
ncbi:MAG: hypothetical protein AAF502_15095 [Bacteroidota bacterium]